MSPPKQLQVSTGTHDPFFDNIKIWPTFTWFSMLQCLNQHRSHGPIFSDCDCNSSFRNKWVVQNSMEVFTLCVCNNITSSYVAHHKQKELQSQIGQCEWALKTTTSHIIYARPLSVPLIKFLSRSCSFHENVARTMLTTRILLFWEILDPSL